MTLRPVKSASEGIREMMERLKRLAPDKLPADDPADRRRCEHEFLTSVGVPPVVSHNLIYHFRDTEASRHAGQFRRGMSLVLSGPAECGKKTAVASVFLELLRQAGTYSPCSMRMVLAANWFRQYVSQPIQSSSDFIDHYSRIEVLAIIDLDPPASFGQQVTGFLDELIYFRRGWRKSTIVTTSLDHGNFKQAFGSHFTRNLLTAGHFFGISSKPPPFVHRCGASRRDPIVHEGTVQPETDTHTVFPKNETRKADDPKESPGPR